MKSTITKTSQTVEMEASGFPEVDVVDDIVGKRIVIKQGGAEVHITREAAGLVAEILESMGGR